ncbi:MAG: hypothetical protein HN742_08370 [Lentisphaerae bacterium]|jgi:hypothetical protein|nr:hypothetical protein [Lentisphaerota bacterium]MBT4822188.1 hypothetical protein [Lentisphaerota bacterium]MBT5610378.1 hypothetical protein [Lentisphaerota bacterium]MBT7056206.1 hypothetical protein [Lentisphaerota bacterium]MBT7841872.1 hypothetical protein [Lentisphaerota bacterium]
MSDSNGFRRKPWCVDGGIPELEHRKYAKAYRESEDYAEGVHLYFGDVHKHSSLSPCAKVNPYNGTLAECYCHARTVAGTDFLAICDHAERMTEGQWSESMGLARETTVPGEFIAWPAVEWATPLYGHRNIYFRDYDVPLISGREITSPPKLWEHIRALGLDALTIPHHAARELSADMTRTDDELEPALEIFSGWGNEEYYGAPLQDTDRCFTRNFAVDTLLRGFHMGFVGGGDGHPAPPADSGITGIYAKDLTLPSLFEALRNRRTIATTGAKIRVDFHINGFPIGSVIRFNQHDINELFPLEIGVTVQGTDTIEQVDIVENGITVHTKTKPRARLDQMAYRWFRPSGPTDGVKRIGTCNNVSRFIYVRVKQRDGHMAWTSPIWLDFYYDE